MTCVGTRARVQSQAAASARSSSATNQNLVLKFMKALPLCFARLHFVEFISGYSTLFLSSYLWIFILNSHDSLCEIVAWIFILVLMGGSWYSPLLRRVFISLVPCFLNPGYTAVKMIHDSWSKTFLLLLSIKRKQVKGKGTRKDTEGIFQRKELKK